MSKCNVEGPVFLTAELKQALKDSHADTFIEGLNSGEQREVVQFISNKIYRESVIHAKTGGNTYTAVDLENYVIEQINQSIKKNNDDLEAASTDIELFSDTIDFLKERNKILNTVKDNIDTLIDMSRKNLANVQGIKIKKEDLKKNDEVTTEISSEEQDNISEEFAEYSDVDHERTTYNDNFSILMDSKAKISGRLKAFLSFVQKSKFDSKKNRIPIRTFFNTEDFMSFNTVYDELHRLLEGTYPSYEAMIEKLENIYNEAVISENHSRAWIGDLLDQLKPVIEDGKVVRAETIDSTTKFLFVRDMAKHKIDMEYVYYNGYRDRNDKYHSELKVMNDNSSTAGNRLLKEWQEAHIKSPILTVNGTYDEDKILKLVDELQSVKKSQSAKALYITIKDALESLGVHTNKDFLKAIARGNAVVFLGKNKLKGAEGFIEALLVQMNELGKVDKKTDLKNPLKANSGFINSSFFKSVARVAAEYEEEEFSNVFRVADKLIYTYTANHHLQNKTRDLKANKNNILEKLGQTLFSGKSFYRDLLLGGVNEDPQSKVFSDWFKVKYTSLQPLMKKVMKKYKRSKGAPELSEMDHEILNIGLEFRGLGKIHKMEVYEGVELNVSKGTFLFPTISDKSRVMMMNGLMFHIATLKEGKLGMDSYAVNLYYTSIVQAEIERIRISADPEFVKALNLKGYNGNSFYMTPYLNDMYVVDGKLSTDTGGIPIIDFIQDKNTTEAVIDALGPSIRSQIRLDLISKAVERNKEWEELGITNGAEFTHDTEMLSTIEGVENTRMNSLEAAVNMTFSEEFNKANIFQLVVGDVAQYFKKDVETTMNNVTKRLASEVAPGDEADYSDMPYTKQIFLDDRFAESSNIDDFRQILDGISPAQYSSMLDRIEELEDSKIPEEQEEWQELVTKVDNLVSNPYMNIESTNAQEYTTWRTHLREMLRYSELTQDEYDDAVKTIESGNPLTGNIFKKVVGPRKPVYSNTELVRIAPGSEEYYYKKTYIKTSSFPLLPQLVNSPGKELELGKLAKAMEAMEDMGDGKKIAVRAAYYSGVKVGFPKESAQIFNEDGTIKDDLDLESYSRLIESSGYRIQQAIPYKAEKKDIAKGSQESKLLFANLLDHKFEFDGQEVSGKQLQREYLNIYHELYKEGESALKAYILNEDGSVNYRKLSRILLRELDARKEYSKPLRDGLAINANGKFTIELWESDYSDKYMALLNSVIAKFVLKQHMPGGSFVLGSDAGFITYEKGGKELMEKEGGIIYAPGFDSTKSLQPQRLDKATGKILPAQILLPFKGRDSEGNLLNVEDFIVKDENGKMIIDTDKIPQEILEGFGFRIPSQLQQSMAYVEIVGFLPEKMGDLVIAPKDFVVQMGSDFDVDKLYAYLYNTIYENGKLSRAKYITPQEKNSRLSKFDEQYATAEKALSELKGELKQEIKDTIRLAIKERRKEIDSKKLGKEARVEAMREVSTEERSKYSEIRKTIKDSKGFDIILDSLQNIEIDRDNFLQEYKNGLQNRIIEIHKAVLLNPEAQKRIVRPLGNGKFLDIANEVHKSKSDKNKKKNSVISHRYNRQKLSDGSAGKDGISIFSSDSILNALAQGKGLVVGEYVYNPFINMNVWEAISVKFGNKYKESKGEIGLTSSIKISGDEFSTPADLIAALQNMSVDNANLEGMAKINLNTDTAGVYTMLSMLGFEEDISAYFMSQPILFDYIKGLRHNRGLLSRFNPTAQQDLVTSLTKKYEDPNNPYSSGSDTEEIDIKGADDALADFEGMDASAVLKDMIINGDKNIANFGNTQISILNKFIKLQTAAQGFSAIKQQLNLDSKGLNKNFYVTKARYKTLSNFPNNPIQGAGTLIGDYVQNALTKKWTFIAPKTMAGFDSFYGAKNLLDFFGENFIETSNTFNFDSIVSFMENVTGKESLTDEELYDLRRHVVHYMHSNIKNKDSKALRDMLFKDTGSGSLYQTLMDIKNTDYGRKNKFLQSLSVSLSDTDTVIIDYNRVAGDSFDDSGTYLGLIDMLYADGEIEDGINPSHIAQQLIYYSILKGGRKGTSFKKYIPVQILNAIIDKSQGFSSEDFAYQYLQNNQHMVTEAEENDISPNSVGELIYKGIELGGKSPLAVRDKTTGKFYIRNKDKITYTEYSTLDDSDVNTYYPGITSTADLEKDEQDMYEDTRMYSGDLLPAIEKNIDSIKNLKDLYEIIKNSNVNGDFNITLDLLYRVKNSSDIKVVFKELPAGVGGNFNPNSNTLTLNITSVKERTVSDQDVLKTIMHEHIHGLTNTAIFRYYQGKTTPEIFEAVSSLRKTMDKALLKIYNNPVEFEKFKAVAFSGYYSLDESALKHIEDITTDVTLLEIIREVAAFPKTQTLPASVINITSSMDRDDFYFYYALSSIYEFVAVVPTEIPMMERKIEGFLNGVKKMYAAILKALGIKNEGVQQILSDVYTLAGLSPSMPVIEYKSEDKMIFANGIEPVYMDTTGKFRTVKGDIWADQTAKVYNKLLNEYYKRYGHEMYTWEKAPNLSEVYDSIKEKINYNDNPMDGLLAISVLEKHGGNGLTKAELTSLKKALKIKKDIGLEAVAIDKKVTPISDIDKKPESPVKPVMIFSDNKEVEDYMQKVRKYSTKSIGNNPISKTLKESDALGELANTVEFNSIKQAGKEISELCKGHGKSTSKWSKVKAISNIKAEHGMYITKSAHIMSGPWNRVRGKSGRQYEHGAVVANKNNFASGGWSVVKDLEGPSHAQGGIQLSIENGKVSLTRGDSPFHAEHGMIIPYTEKSLIVDTKKEKEIIQTVTDKVKYVKRKNVKK